MITQFRSLQQIFWFKFNKEMLEMLLVDIFKTSWMKLLMIVFSFNPVSDKLRMKLFCQQQDSSHLFCVCNFLIRKHKCFFVLVKLALMIGFYWKHNLWTTIWTLPVFLPLFWVVLLVLIQYTRLWAFYMSSHNSFSEFAK